MRVREIEVAGIANRIPVAGFGCSSLASVGRKEALRLLEAAFDAGIRHFDVARYYGYGEAEGILGEFLKTRRAQVTVTTKFGIEPPRRSGALRVALGAGRQVLRLMPWARKAAQQRASSVLVKSNAFGVEDARRNLETSLRELRTECIDFYLLHDYAPGDAAPDELIAFLRQAVAAGKIRYFGLGTSFENVEQALRSEPELCGVLQFQNSVLARNREKLPALTAPPGLVITHGALGEAYGRVSSFLKADEKKAKQWSQELGADCCEENTLAALLLNYAVEANAGGLVLFSARSVERIRWNAKAVLESEVTPRQVKMFTQFVERDLDGKDQFLRG